MAGVFAKHFPVTIQCGGKEYTIDVGVRSPSPFYAIDPDRDVLPRCQVCGFGLDDLDAQLCVPCEDNAYNHASSYAQCGTSEWCRRFEMKVAELTEGRR